MKLRNTSLFVALVCLPGVASADTPRGTYVLEKARTAKASYGGARLPSCGIGARTLLRSYTKLTAVYSTGVMVGSNQWILESATRDRIQARQPDSSRDVSIQLFFWRQGKVAKAWIHFSSLDEAGNPTCLDALDLSGDYRP